MGRPQAIRPSQFVTTFGPGAIMEGTEGPRVIPQANLGLFMGSLAPNPFEVSDQRMRQGLLGGARIFRLPSNAELRKPDSRYIYLTKRFPYYALCLRNRQHGGRGSVLYAASNCPSCQNEGRRDRDAIRFVRACRRGHLDDVHWDYAVHQGSSGCGGSDWYWWIGGGGALTNVRVQCPRCSRSRNLGEIYGMNWPCSGRFPEREGTRDAPVRPGCTEQSKITQRQAANLRIPELQALFTIPPRTSSLHHLLALPAVLVTITNLKGLGRLTEADFRTSLDGLVGSTQLPGATRDSILRHGWPSIEAAIADTLQPVPATYSELILEEFHALRDAAVKGYPRTAGGADHEFEVVREKIVTFSSPKRIKLRIAPISRLRTVTVQKGYRREIRSAAGGPADVVDVAWQDDMGERWYPGASLLGEGVFVCIDSDDGWDPALGGDAAGTWDRTRRSLPTRQQYPAHLFQRGGYEELHPGFVWWHVFSHLLLRALSVDSGYSAASIRERVFLEADPSGTRYRGGCVLYASQPGADGTLGGLISLVPNFQRLVLRALELARYCSNDPLCCSHRFSGGEATGAACMGCLFVSETSCEHRNAWLDRSIFLENSL